MGDRKLFAAFLTSVLSYFLLPLVIMQPYDTYFEVAFAVSIVTVPIIFTYGIFTSILADRIARKGEATIEPILFLLHIGFGVCFTGVAFLIFYPVIEEDFFMYAGIVFKCGMICSFIYYVFDFLCKKFLRI